MVFLTGSRFAAETGGIVSVVTSVQARRPEVVITAVSARSRSVFIVRKERGGGKKLAPRICVIRGANPRLLAVIRWNDELLSDLDLVRIVQLVAVRVEDPHVLVRVAVELLT